MSPKSPVLGVITVTETCHIYRKTRKSVELAIYRCRLTARQALNAGGQRGVWLIDQASADRLWRRVRTIPMVLESEVDADGIDILPHRR